MDISQITGTVLFAAAFLELIFVFILWFKGKSKITFHLGLAVLFVAFYILGFGGFVFFEHNKLFWIKNCWFGMLITPAYLTFVYYFIGRTKYIKLKSFLWYLSGIILVSLALTTSYFTESISPEYPYRDIEGPLGPLGRIYAAAGLIMGLFYLLKEYFKSTGFRKLQLKYFILGNSIHIIGGITESVIFHPFFGLWHIGTGGVTVIMVFSSLLGVALATYAIFKRQLFGIRVILTEILVGVIAVILLFQTLLAETLLLKILGFVIFLSSLLVGYLLIRVTQKEIIRKEQAESLAKQLKELNETLEDRVKQRTQELEKSYQEIKKRKDELEKFYNLTVGRELRMVELKKEIQELKKKTGGK